MSTCSDWIDESVFLGTHEITRRVSLEPARSHPEDVDPYGNPYGIPLLPGIAFKRRPRPAKSSNQGLPFYSYASPNTTAPSLSTEAPSYMSIQGTRIPGNKERSQYSTDFILHSGLCMKPPVTLGFMLGEQARRTADKLNTFMGSNRPLGHLRTYGGVTACAHTQLDANPVGFFCAGVACVDAEYLEEALCTAGFHHARFSAAGSPRTALSDSESPGTGCTHTVLSDASLQVAARSGSSNTSVEISVVNKDSPRIQAPPTRGPTRGYFVVSGWDGPVNCLVAMMIQPGDRSQQPPNQRDKFAPVDSIHPLQQHLRRAASQHDHDAAERAAQLLGIRLSDIVVPNLSLAPPIEDTAESQALSAWVEDVRQN
ncbi:hypothetical protein PVAG01_02560 [Phlyctema vagabunda]|uniref:Uncharacterized protein n=1 Tax=Phlyctema vagabunda TaxID=108571 RepID=A0ABR4PR69_9HELO